MGSISIEDILKNNRIDVPTNLFDLVNLNDIKFLEKNNLFPLSEEPVYAELSIEDFEDIVLTENYRSDYSNLYARGLYLEDESSLKYKDQAVSVYYSEGKYYLSELYGDNSIYNTIVPIAKNITKKHPEIKFPPFLCKIINYQFKENEIKPESLRELRFLLLSIKRFESHIDSYAFIRNGVVEGVLWGWWPNNDGLLLNFEMHFEDKKRLEKFSENIKKIKEINSISGKNIVNIIMSDNHQSFQFVYNGKIIDSNEIDQILIEEKKKEQNQVPLFNGENKEKEIFRELQLEQSGKLTSEEKKALVIYKSQLYYSMNKIISLIRTREGKVEDEDLEKYIEEGYKQLKESYNSQLTLPPIGSSTTQSNDEKIFGTPGFPTYEIYKDTVIKNIPKVTLALKKVRLRENLIVYRYVKSNDFNELGKGFLSTSISMRAALSFYNGRYSEEEKCILYKINLLKDSPMVFFSEELRTGKIDYDDPFKEDQKEVLIDSRNFNFHIESVKKYENLSINGRNCPQLYLVEITAKPKTLKKVESKEDNGIVEKVNNYKK